MAVDGPITTTNGGVVVPNASNQALAALPDARNKTSAVIAGNNATSEDIANIRAHMGLDKPIAVQYVLWMSQVLQGDLGYSYYLSKPVTALVAQRMEPTLSLALGTVLLAVCIAVPLGSLAAWRMGGWLDRGVSAVAVAGFSVPVFVIAYLLI